MDDIHPSYAGCPTICGDSGAMNKGFCEHCPIKKAKDSFKEATIEMLNEKVAGKWEQFGFENLLNTVVTIAQIEAGGKKNLPLKTASLVSIYKNEKYKLQRVDDWKLKMERERQKRKAGL